MNIKTLYAFIVSFVLLISVIVLNRITFDRMKRFTKAVAHTQEVITSFESISNDFKSAQIYAPAYKNDSLKNFYNLYKADSDSINKELTFLKYLIQDNPVQVKRVDTLSFLINRQLPALMKKDVAGIIQSGQGWRLDSIYVVHQMINQGISHEKELLRKRDSELKESTYLNNLLSIAFSILATGIIFFTFLSNLFISKERKWLEGFLESILNTSQNGVAHFKAIRENGKIIDFKIEFLNKAIHSLLDIDPSEFSGKKLSELPSYLNEPGFTGQYIQVIEAGKPAEFETLYKRGQVERWLLVSLARLNDGITVSFHDISQLKKFEEELKEKISDLEHSNAELEQYAYVASHDLQEPLRKIRSFGSLLQDTQGYKLDEKGRQQLEKMMHSAERMSSLIKDILSFSSLKKQSDFTQVDLNQILKNVLQDLDLLITQKNAIIKSETLPSIEAIPLQMTQLFYNLINNSLKFSKENIPPLINISCKALNGSKKATGYLKPATCYEITISDNGIGFGQDYQEQIFGLFKRLNDRYSYPGSGIGLALCKKVVENHNGSIKAKGKESEGAVFYIYLPEKQE